MVIRINGGSLFDALIIILIGSAKDIQLQYFNNRYCLYHDCLMHLELEQADAEARMLKENTIGGMVEIVNLHRPHERAVR